MHDFYQDRSLINPVQHFPPRRGLNRKLGGFFMKDFMNIFISGNAADGYELKIGGYIALAVIILILLAIVGLSQRGKRAMSTKQLVFSAVAMALALVTSFIKFVDLPMGGSMTLCSMFFIVLIGYFYGPRIGIIAGAAYGLLQLIVEPQIYHWVQVFLDYPLAFGALGISGFFCKRKYGLLTGYIAGAAGRYLCHVISGYVFFGEYAEGNPILYTFSYNATYILPEVIITVIILLIPAVRKGIDQVRAMARR